MTQGRRRNRRWDRVRQSPAEQEVSSSEKPVDPNGNNESEQSRESVFLRELLDKCRSEDIAVALRVLALPLTGNKRIRIARIVDHFEEEEQHLGTQVKDILSAFELKAIRHASEAAGLHEELESLFPLEGDVGNTTLSVAEPEKDTDSPEELTLTTTGSGVNLTPQERDEAITPVNESESGAVQTRGSLGETQEPDTLDPVVTTNQPVDRLISTTPSLDLATVAFTGSRVRIVGCGQCGSQVAATFTNFTPDFIPANRPDFYPVRAIAFDSRDAQRENLIRDWNWTRSIPPAFAGADGPERYASSTVFVLPPAPIDEVLAKILDSDAATDYQAGIFGGAQYGIGGRPELGRYSAESVLFGDSEAAKLQSEAIRESLAEVEFDSGILVACNSLAGGTGTGFSPVVTSYLKDIAGFRSEITINLSILPGEKERRDARFPRSILATLHRLLTADENTAGIVDTVVVADNDALDHMIRALALVNSGAVSKISEGRMIARDSEHRDQFTEKELKENDELLARAENFYDYENSNRGKNELLRDIFMPILLAPYPKYQVSDLSSELDPADMASWIKEGYGLARLPSLSTLAYSKMPLDSFVEKRNFNPFSRKQKYTPQGIRQALTNLAEDAARNCTLTMGTEEKLVKSERGVAVLYGPDRFFREILRMDGQYIQHLTAELRSADVGFGADDLKAVSCLKFDDDMDYIGLSVLISGIGESVLDEVCEKALGSRRYQHIDTETMGGTFADHIRQIGQSEVDDLLNSEIRDALLNERR